VLAVPGHPFDARVAGCNFLIRDGATLVRGARDILDQVGDPVVLTQAYAPARPVQPAQPRRSLAPDDILFHLSHTPIAEDQLMRSLGAAASAVAPLLMDLELDGKIIRQAGGLLARAV